MHVEPPPFPFIKTEQVGVKKEMDCIEINFFRNHASETSKTYEVKLAFFENSKPEEFLIFIPDFKNTLEATGVTSSSRHNKYLITRLWE